MFSLTGQVVYSEVVNVVSSTNIEFPVSEWNKGMYLVRIGNDKNAIVNRNSKFRTVNHPLYRG